MMFSMGDAQKHSSSSTPPRRTTGRTIRVPRNRPGRHNGITIHSCAIPTYLAAAPIAFTLDEYEALNSVSNRTAFTLNSPAHQVPFAIIPSSPIELGECGTKNQFISLFLFLELSLVSPASPTTIGLIPPQFENRVNMRRICHILVGLLVCAGLLRTVSGFIFDYLHPEYVSSFPSYLYFLRAVPFLITAGAVETILFVIKRRNK